MKSFRKNLCVIFSTLMLLLLVFFAEAEEAAVSPYFQIRNDAGFQNISVFDAQDGNCYVFLPSYAGLENLKIVLPTDQEFFLGGVRLYDKMSCSDFELEKPYEWTADGQKLGTLWFYQSRNVATMYIETASGDMTEIHNDINYEEYASMTLYSPDGSINYYDVSSQLKGRGNATWDLDKRPYLLTLSADGDLLGMGSAQKWVLLANAYDETNLNNKLVYDLASQVNLKWSPDSQFVDLYLNGEYSGLYLLTEKIEIHENRLNIDESSGDFLCKLDLFQRIELQQRPFESSMGRLVDVCYPENMSVEDFDYITYLVYLMEKDICEGADLSHSEILDLDSWVRRYLIDEISGNIDSDMTSSYFYFTDEKFFAGPIWDYDMAFGNNLRNQEPHALIAKNQKKANYFSTPYYSSLYDNVSFYNRMIEIYRMEFVPLLEKMINRDLDVLITQIHEASRMNSIRWRSMYDEWFADKPGFVRTPTDLNSYFTRRVNFLNSVWLEQKEVCTLQFEPTPGSPYWNISIEKGTCLETSYMDLVDTVWINTQTGQPMDFRSPITEDLILTTQIPEDTSSEESAEIVVTSAASKENIAEENKRDNERLLWVAVFLSMLVCMLLADGCLRRRERTQEQKKTRIRK